MQPGGGTPLQPQEGQERSSRGVTIQTTSTTHLQNPNTLHPLGVSLCVCYSCYSLTPFILCSKCLCSTSILNPHLVFIANPNTTLLKSYGYSKDSKLIDVIAHFRSLRIRCDCVMLCEKTCPQLITRRHVSERIIRILLLIIAELKV